MSDAGASTHVVPEGGLQAWLQADTSDAPAATLDAHLDVQVLTRWGEWAYVRCSNGWMAWVDGRRLHPLAGAGTPTTTVAGAPARVASPVSASAPRAKSVGQTVTLGGRDVRVTPALGGALLVVIGALLAWFSFDGGSLNGFDISVKFLFDREAADGPDLAWLLIVLAVAGAGLSMFLPSDREVRMVGLAVLGVTALFVVQLQRSLSVTPADVRPSLLSTVGIGVYATLIGAILMIVQLPLGAGGRR